MTKLNLSFDISKTARAIEKIREKCRSKNFTSIKSEQNV